MDAMLRMNPAGREEKHFSVIKFAEKAAQGTYFVKHNWHGNPHKKLFKLDPGTGILNWDNGAVNLKDMLEVKAGKKIFNVDAKTVFSIILPERALDLQAADEAERDYWVQGLRDFCSRITRSGSISVASAPPTATGTKPTTATGPAPATPTSADFAGTAVIVGKFMKHGRRGKPHERSLKVDPATGIVDWGSGAISLREAVEIIPGKNTAVFERVKLKIAHPRVCFSIVLAQRTLDLQANSEDERDLWVNGLQTLKAKLGPAPPASPSRGSTVMPGNGVTGSPTSGPLATPSASPPSTPGSNSTPNVSPPRASAPTT